MNLRRGRPDQNQYADVISGSDLHGDNLIMGES